MSVVLAQVRALFCDVGDIVASCGDVLGDEVFQAVVNGRSGAHAGRRRRVVFSLRDSFGVNVTNPFVQFGLFLSPVKDGVGSFDCSCRRGAESQSCPVSTRVLRNALC